MDHHSQPQQTVVGDKDMLDQRLLHAAISDIPKAAIPNARKPTSVTSKHGKPKPQRLHPRNFVPYQAAGNFVEPAIRPVKPVEAAVQSVETAVASFINVVLDQGGTSVGNVLVPAESTVFNLNGYGPVTIKKNPPPEATSFPNQQNPRPLPAPESSHPHRHSHAPQQTAQPASKPTSQAEPTAAASASTRALVQQTPMSIQVPGSSSQVILSSPPTPLPPSPSNSTSAIGSQSYFSSTTSQSTSSTQLSSISSIALSQTATTSQPPQISNVGSINGTSSASGR
ncbi:MAG: hypothetical protein L6R39_007226 [Caloplaca ligustica]|nr:MAG: hypothetical protein L6R39_007226 [Caloplaca ligustica]